jgi:hypothetical protein
MQHIDVRALEYLTALSKYGKEEVMHPLLLMQVQSYYATTRV